MKKSLQVALGCLIWSGCGILIMGLKPNPISAQTSPQPTTSSVEQIDDFTAIYTLNQDTGLYVVEQINYFTPNSKHGIYRYLPLKYDDGHQIEVQWQGVTDENGEAIPAQKSKSNNNSQAQLKIGDPNATFKGRQHYQISYLAYDVLTEFEDHWEIYWDVLGEDWTFPIKKTKVVFNSPVAEITKVACYSGKYGSDDGLCQTEISTDKKSAIFTYDQEVKGGENVTIVVGLSKDNQLTERVLSIREKLGRWLEKYGWMLWKGVIIGLAILAFWSYRRANKDEQVFIDDQQITLQPSGETKRRPLFYKSPVLMFYDPFIGSDFSPAQAGYLEKMTFHYRLVASEIFYLVEKGYLTVEKIKPEEKTGWQKFFSRGKKVDDDFIFKRAKIKTEHDEAELVKLKPYQKTILDTLIPPGVAEVRFSEKVESLVKKMTTIKDALTITLTQEGYIFKGKNGSLILLMILGILFLMTGIFSWMGLIILIATSQMLNRRNWRRTALGSYYTSLVLGLKETIKTGEWFYEVQEKIMWIEAMIPFSMALGVTKELADKMSALAEDPAEMEKLDRVNTNWLMIDMMNGRFERSMVGSFEKAFGTQYQNLTSSSSSGSGFSSSGGGGGGGGGFSGGGSGGGGGGSW